MDRNAQTAMNSVKLQYMSSCRTLNPKPCPPHKPFNWKTRSFAELWQLALQLLWALRKESSRSASKISERKKGQCTWHSNSHHQYCHLPDFASICNSILACIGRHLIPMGSMAC